MSDRRPTRAELAAAAGKTVPDIIDSQLLVLLCGINPGLWSAAVGHHFAHPGNRFWKALAASGFTDEVLSPSEEARLREVGVGVTNLVQEATRSAAELDRERLRRGAGTLKLKVRRWKPLTVAVLGLTAYRAAFGRPNAVVGEQTDRLVEAALWLLPNPSGAQGHYPFEQLVEELRALRRKAGAPTLKVGRRACQPRPDSS